MPWGPSAPVPGGAAPGWCGRSAVAVRVAQCRGLLSADQCGWLVGAGGLSVLVSTGCWSFLVSAGKCWRLVSAGQCSCWSVLVAGPLGLEGPLPWLPRVSGGGPETRGRACNGMMGFSEFRDLGPQFPLFNFCPPTSQRIRSSPPFVQGDTEARILPCNVLQVALSQMQNSVGGSV